MVPLVQTVNPAFLLDNTRTEKKIKNILQTTPFSHCTHHEPRVFYKSLTDLG